MIFDVSADERETTQSINSLVGDSYPLFTRLRMGGIGSTRMILQHVSKDIEVLHSQHSGLEYASIELRPKGIIIRFKSKSHEYAWAIPFYQLAVYQSDTFSIHGQGSFMKFTMDSAYPYNAKFIKKMLRYKADYDAAYPSI